MRWSWALGRVENLFQHFHVHLYLSRRKLLPTVITAFTSSTGGFPKWDSWNRVRVRFRNVDTPCASHRQRVSFSYYDRFTLFRNNSKNFYSATRTIYIPSTLRKNPFSLNRISRNAEKKNLSMKYEHYGFVHRTIIIRTDRRNFFIYHE